MKLVIVLSAFLLLGCVDSSNCGTSLFEVRDRVFIGNAEATIIGKTNAAGCSHYYSLLFPSGEIRTFHGDKLIYFGTEKKGE